MSRSVVKPILLLAAVAALITVTIVFDINEYLRAVLEWIRDRGALGVVVYGLLYVAATVLFVPGSILTLGAGFIYGVVYGTAYVSVASTIGATAAFLVGRYLARHRMQGSARCVQ